MTNFDICSNLLGSLPGLGVGYLAKFIETWIKAHRGNYKPTTVEIYEKSNYLDCKVPELFSNKKWGRIFLYNITDESFSDTQRYERIWIKPLKKIPPEKGKREFHLVVKRDSPMVRYAEQLIKDIGDKGIYLRPIDKVESFGFAIYEKGPSEKAPRFKLSTGSFIWRIEEEDIELRGNKIDPAKLLKKSSFHFPLKNDFLNSLVNFLELLEIHE